MRYLNAKLGITLTPILFGLALLVVLIIGWGYYHSKGKQSQSEDEKVRLVLAINVSHRERPFFVETVDAFMKEHPNIEVEIRNIAGVRYYQKILIMMAGKVAPDLMWMGQSFAEFAYKGAFLDITDRLKDFPTDEFLPQALSWYRMNGRQYGVPYAIHMRIFAYNKKLFDEAGIPYPSDDWDFDEFLEITKKLTLDKDGDGQIDQYGFRGGLHRATFGAEIFSDDGQLALCNTPEMLNFFQTRLDLAFKYKVQPTMELRNQEGRNSSIERYAPFAQGRYAIIDAGNGDRVVMLEKCADIDWDYVLCPKVKRHAQWSSSAAIVISADTRHPDESWELCKVFIGDKFQKSMALSGMPTNINAAEEVIAEHRGTPSNLKAVLKAYDFLYPTPRVPNLKELEAIYVDAEEKIMLRMATPRDALDDAQRKMTLAIKKLNERNR